MKLARNIFLYSLFMPSLGLYASIAKFEPNPTQNFLNAVASGANPAQLEELFTPININARNAKGETALITYVKSDNKPAVLYLLARGASLDIATTDGNDTALIWACSKANSKMVKILLQAGTNPNIQNSGGITSLAGSISWYRNETDKAHRQIMNGIMQALIEHPSTNIDLAIPPLADKAGAKTPLMLACDSGNIVAVIALLDSGADVFLIDQNGDDAETIAQKKKDAESNCNIADKWEAIEIAIKKRKEDIQKITPESLDVSLGGITIPKPVLAIVVGYLPKAKYSKLTTPIICSVGCYCANAQKGSALSASPSRALAQETAATKAIYNDCKNNQ